jgi:hypothetical protein
MFTHSFIITTRLNNFVIVWFEHPLAINELNKFPELDFLENPN